jgi:hypothetical protein
MHYASVHLNPKRDSVIGPRRIVGLLALGLLVLPCSSHASAIGAIGHLIIRIFGEGSVARELGQLERAADDRAAIQAIGGRTADVASPPSMVVETEGRIASSSLHWNRNEHGFDDLSRGAGAATRELSNRRTNSECGDDGGHVHETNHPSACSKTRY